MRVTVCEITNDQAAFPDTWKALREHAARERSELLLLPEFAFLPAVWEREREAPGEWNALIDRSLKIPPRFPELGCTWIVGAAPATEGGRRRIQGFAWS